MSAHGRSFMWALAIVTAAAVLPQSIAAADCLVVPARGGVIGRNVKKSGVAAAIRQEFAKRISRPPNADAARLENEFLGEIDYASYLANVSFMNDSDVSERIRRDLNAMSRSRNAGNRFLLLLADAYYRTYPADLYRRNRRVGTAASWLALKTRIGVHYIETLAPRYGTDAEGKAIYQLIGTYTLFQIASHIDEELAAQRLERSAVKGTLEVLQRHNVPVGSAKSDWAKAWDYLRRGDIRKLFSRLDEKFVRHYEAIVGDSYAATRQSLPCDLPAFTISGRSLGVVATAYILEWRTVRATYLARPAGGGAPLTLPGSTVLAMSASYTSADGEPYGFTVVRGTVRNAMISRRMDALVHIRAGTVGAVDLRAAIQCSGTSIRPALSLPDYDCLLHCVREARESVFQTHLLYWQGRPAFDPSTAPVANGKIERKERRVLALLPGRAVVVDIPVACTFAEATFLLEKTLDLLRIRRAEVQAAVNLDTGSYDVLEVFCPSGRNYSHKQRRARQATNLLVFVRQ